MQKTVLLSFINSLFFALCAHAEFAKPIPWRLDQKEWASLTSSALTPGIPVSYIQNRKYPELKVAYTRLEFQNEPNCLKKDPCQEAKNQLSGSTASGITVSSANSKTTRSCTVSYSISLEASEALYLYTQRGPTCSLDTLVWSGRTQVLSDAQKKNSLDHLFKLISQQSEKLKTNPTQVSQ